MWRQGGGRLAERRSLQLPLPAQYLTILTILTICQRCLAPAGSHPNPYPDLSAVCFTLWPLFATGLQSLVLTLVRIRPVVCGNYIAAYMTIVFLYRPTSTSSSRPVHVHERT